jgi:tetratricopeptide (TPR) repeat protein
VFLVKLVVVWQLKDHVLLQPDAGLDTTVYLALAQRVAGGDFGLGPGLYFVSPLYIYFVASVLGLTGSVLAVRLVQIVLGTLAVALVWWAAREWFGSRAAWMAATFAALTGLLSFYETLLLQAALDPVLTAFALAALAAALNRSRRENTSESHHRAAVPWFFAAGVALGVQALNRPNVLLAATGVALLVVLTRRFRAAAALVCGILLAIAPLTIRNAVVAGDWSPVSSHGGLNFYIGNNAEADGTYHAVPGITPSIAGQQEDARRVAEKAVGRSLDDAEVSAYFYGLGLSWIRNHPSAALKLLFRKLAYVFNAAHLSLNFSYPFYARDAGTLLGVLVVGPWLLIPLGLTGLAWAAWVRRDAAFMVWASLGPLYAFSVAVFFVSERYRLPLLLPLCIGAGAALDEIVRTMGRRRLRTVTVVVGVLVALSVVANWPAGLDDARSEERTRMAERMIGLNRFDEGEAWTKRAEELHHTPGIVHFRVGRRLMASGRPADALPHLQRAAQLDPEQREVDFALGQALLESGRASESIPHLRRALEAGVRPDLSGFDLARALAATGDRQAAIRVLQDVRPARADDADSWFALGQLAFELQAGAMAEIFYRQSVIARPTFAAARQQLGLTYAILGRFQEAARELEQAVALSPADPAAHLNLAVAYAELGRTADARNHARRALDLNPAYDRARKLLDALAR